ncbi:MAG: DNA-binding protein [Bacteroidetes bacterium]|nr:MAG: DNA-binding protein [Bacteroidota bacterium]
MYYFYYIKYSGEFMIISFLNQKGGTAKSTLARAVAVEFAKNKWQVQIADMDLTQQTAFKWSIRRAEAGIEPAIDVVVYKDPQTALKAEALNDLLIVDGKAFADSHVIDIAKASDLIVLPVGISTDDLQPTLNLAMELVSKGIKRKSIYFVVCKVLKNGEKEAMTTRSSIEDFNFEVAQGWINMQTAYSQAMDTGRSLTETRYKDLNQTTDKIIEQIFNKANSVMNNGE